MSMNLESTSVNWPRLLVCGMIAGFIWTLLSFAILSLLGDDFFMAVGGGRLRAPGPTMHMLLFFISLACGVWAIWLYLSIRPRFSSTLQAAIVAGFGWWIISSLQSFKWIIIGEVPFTTVLLPFVMTLPAMILAIFLGAWLYEK
jgi:hypothetical protein